MASKGTSGTSIPTNEKQQKPTGLAANPYNPNSAAYLAYPVKHVVSSLYRRMTEPPDQPVNKLLDAPIVSKNNNSQSTTHTPTRSFSPFQTPPLTPLELHHDLSPSVAADTLLLTRSLAEEIRLLVPPRLQLLESWRLAYSLELHGASLATLYDHCAKSLGPLGATQRGGFILVIKDGSESAESGSVFGAYLTDAPKPSLHYYGTGECFLWGASILPNLNKITAQSLALTASNKSSFISAGQNGGGNGIEKLPPTVSNDLLELAGLPPPPSSDTTNAQRTTTVRGERRRSSAASQSNPRSPIGIGNMKEQQQQQLSSIPSGSSTPDRIRFKAFPYSGINDFMIYCQTDFLSVGGGDGHYGLWLDDQLEEGISEQSLTFGNEPLSEQGKKFEVLGVEIWHVGAGG